jgi:hypothetical protein
MKKLALTTMAAILALSGAAFAAGDTWLVTEENTGGIKGAQGNWSVKTEGAKLTGSATMQSGSGDTLTYTVDGTIENGVYTVKLNDRSDGKKNCVWTGHVPSGAGSQQHGLVGYAECEGAKLIVRASIVGK